MRAKIGRFTNATTTTVTRLGTKTSWVARATTVSRSFAFKHAPELVLALAHAAQTVLHDHDRAVDDQAEVECAEAHEVAADAVRHHTGDREQHRERDHQSRDERGTQIPEEQEQHDDDEEGAFDKALRNRGDSAVHQLRAIVHRIYVNTGRQRLAHLVETLGDTLRRPCGCSRRSA